MNDILLQVGGRITPPSGTSIDYFLGYSDSLDLYTWTQQPLPDKTFANTNLTFDAHRTHSANNYNFTLSSLNDCFFYAGNSILLSNTAGGSSTLLLDAAGSASLNGATFCALGQGGAFKLILNPTNVNFVLTATQTIQINSSPGLAGQVITSQGASTRPTWSTPTGGMFVSSNNNGTWAVTDFTIPSLTTMNVPNTGSVYAIKTLAADEYLKIVTTSGSEEVALGISGTGTVKSKSKIFNNEGGLVQRVDIHIAPLGGLPILATLDKGAVHVLDTTLGIITITLNHYGGAGRTLWYHHVRGTNTCTINSSSGSYTIRSGTSDVTFVTLAQGVSAIFVFTGTEWLMF